MVVFLFLMGTTIPFILKNMQKRYFNIFMQIVIFISLMHIFFWVVRGVALQAG